MLSTSEGCSLCFVPLLAVGRRDIDAQLAPYSSPSSMCRSAGCYRRMEFPLLPGFFVPSIGYRTAMIKMQIWNCHRDFLDSHGSGLCHVKVWDVCLMGGRRAEGE